MGLSWASYSTLIYTSGLILCSPFVFIVLHGTTFIWLPQGLPLHLVCSLKKEICSHKYFVLVCSFAFSLSFLINSKDNYKYHKDVNGAFFIWVAKTTSVFHNYPTKLVQNTRAHFFLFSQMQNHNQYKFSRTFVPATCICFKFWLVHWIVCAICEWL